MVSKPLKREILITGATGFIGANLANYFVEHGYQVHITLRHSSDKWRFAKRIKKLNLHYVDLLERDRIRGIIFEIKPKIIFHCATYGGFSFQDEHEKIIETNIIGTKNLLYACIKSGFDYFVNTGTSSEYGIKKTAMKESDLLEPFSDYGASKASETLICQGLAKREGLPITTLRLFSPYGYYEAKNRLIPSLILASLNKAPVQLSSPKPVRDFLFIEDVIRAYVKVIDNTEKARGEIFNIGSGRQHSVAGVLNEVSNLSGQKLKPLWKSIPNLRVEPAVWQADISKAKKLLDWQPEYSLAEGLKKTMDWFKLNSALYDEKE